MEQLERADEKAATMISQIKNLEYNKAELEEMINLQNNKILSRDNEIARLNSMNVSAPNLDKISKDYSAEMSQSNIQKLNTQIDFLNKENQRLESEVKDKNQVINTSEKYKYDRMAMSKKYTEEQKENKRLTADINQMETVIQELKNKVEENSSVIAKRNLVPLADLTKERERRDELLEQIKSLETELRQYKRSDEHVQHTLTSAVTEKQTLNTRLEEMIDENRLLQNSIDEKLHEVRQITKERDILRSDSDFYKDRAKQMEANYERYKKMSEELSQEKNMTSGEYYSKLLNVENMLSEVKKENSEMAFELERTKRQKITYESELDELKETTFKFKNEFESNNTTLTRIKIMYDSTLKDKQRLEKELREKTKEMAERLQEVNMNSTNESVSYTSSQI